jgi:hypothetical protein
MGNQKESAISRREFARRAALVSAAASLAPADLLRAESSVAPVPAQQAEVESRIQSIFAQYGKRLSDAQKTDIRRLAAEAQPALDRLREFAAANGDGPGLYLKPLIEREKKHSLMPEKPKPASAPKNS